MMPYQSVSVRYPGRGKQVYAKESVLRMYFKTKTLSAVHKKKKYLIMQAAIDACASYLRKQMLHNEVA